ncbi:MAG: M56 family metallopeptidase [Vicinamibacterales bacterium]
MTLMSLPVVLDAVAKASVILALTALVTASLRRASASARHFVWTLGLLSALAAPALSVALPRWELPLVRVRGDVPAVRIDARASTSRMMPAPGSGGRAPASDVSATTADSAMRPGPAQITTRNGASIPWRAIVLVAWSAGAAVVLGRMLLGLAAVLWLSRRTPVVTDAPWLAQARSLADGLGLSRVRFLRTSASTMPMAWGIFRSSVLMPADADAWPAHRVRVVLLHELAHVKRRDCLTHLVAQLACAAYWFNPLAWMAARRLRTERERACDDLVLASGTRGSDYADQLLDIARVMRSGRFPAVLSGASLAMAQRSQLEGRLIAILDPSVPRRGLSRVRAFAASVVFAVLIVPVASVQPWAEETAAVKTLDAESAAAPAAAQSRPPAGKPIESYPGQAADDNGRNARHQDVVQGDLQGRMQGAVQGAALRGVDLGAASRLTAGIVEHVVSSVAETVTSAAQDAVADHDAREQDDRGHDGPQGRALDPRTVNALMEALKDTDKDVRETAMNALVRMRDPRMFDPLVAALKDSSADVREHAAFGLGQLRDARAAEPLAAALKDENPGVREQAAFALGQLRDKKVVEPLISALKDSNPGVREQAAFALGQMRDAKSIEALVVALKDGNPGVREQAAFALGQMRDPRAIDGLMVALKDTNASVRQQAAFALGQIR